MQTLSSFSTSLVSAQASNEASWDRECVQSPDKPPQYEKKKKKNKLREPQETWPQLQIMSALSIFTALVFGVSLHWGGRTYAQLSISIYKGNIFTFEEQSK